MLPPPRFRRSHSGVNRQIEAEPPVVGGIAQKEDRRSSERVRRRQDGVHQSLTDATPLVVREHPQRPEPQRRLTVDCGRTAHHVSYYLVVLFGDDRELGDDVTVSPERSDQNGFRGNGFTGSGKGGGVQGEDTVMVAG